ncbi:hypothetical protein LIER_23564 [Lithospermum erythrorhizon]|uniref:Uncharacterized protein n=1 Tax=Lithospermum erythrorhizon TaxID=34254 RepID=A0AAV3R3P0_LITER
MAQSPGPDHQPTKPWSVKQRPTQTSKTDPDVETRRPSRKRTPMLPDKRGPHDDVTNDIIVGMSVTWQTRGMVTWLATLAGVVA